jgi:hypothetical protein
MKMGRILAAICLAATATACATSFTGSPYVEGGRAGCEAKCKGDGMDVAGLVYMGEYSSACICSVPGKVGANRTYLMAAAGAVGGGVAGVEMQRQRQEQQRSQQPVR